MLAKVCGVGSTSLTTSQTTPCLGKLRAISKDPTVWESTGGLIYGPDIPTPDCPNCTNRVLHVLNHTEDIPTRQGPHGVFHDEGSGALRVLDEAWSGINLQDIKPVKSNPSNPTSNDLFCYDFEDEIIGYIGGQGGNANGNPETSIIAMFMKPNTTEVLSAFPVESLDFCNNR